MRADARKNYDHLLEVARRVVAEQGADASLRDVSRRAGVGIGTLYRHFPTREALLEALLREGFDNVTVKAAEFEKSEAADQALISWLREMVALTYNHRGVLASMATAIDDENSALHASCVKLRASGAQLLARAQEAGKARQDIDGTDLLALVSALAWLNDQAPFAARVNRLFGLIAGAIMMHPGSGDTSLKSPILTGESE
jgi:AcrR family transcriptional regulator